MKKQFLDKSDIYISIIIGLVTILTAYVTFVGSMWGSTSVANYSKAIVELNDANTSYLEHIQGGLTTEEEEQVAKEFQEGWDESEKLLLSADQANSNNDKYLLMTVILAISIFFGSLSLTLRSDNLKIYFFILSIILFITAIIWTFTLPLPF